MLCAADFNRRGFLFGLEGPFFYRLSEIAGLIVWRTGAAVLSCCLTSFLLLIANVRSASAFFARASACLVDVIIYT